MEMVNHPHRTKKIDIKHALNRLYIRINGCHGVANAASIRYKSATKHTRPRRQERCRNSRIVNQKVQTPLGQLRNIFLRLNHRLLIGNIQLKPSDSGFVEMLARLEGQKSGDRMDATALVLEDESLSDATGATPCNQGKLLRLRRHL